MTGVAVTSAVQLMVYDCAASTLSLNFTVKVKLPGALFSVSFLTLRVGSFRLRKVCSGAVLVSTDSSSLR